MKKNQFASRFGRYVENGTAAVFIGAGLSVHADYPSWRKLLVEIAGELDLDIDREHDLAGVVQYFLNRSAQTRSQLGPTIREAFPPRADVPASYRILARLPFRHIWTTNYDPLIEQAFALQRKRLDRKIRDADFATEDPWAHATLYKMHGTAERPDDVVIARDDYEMYRRKRPRFLQALAGHSVSKHILFLGLSFTDPNLLHLLGLIREMSVDTPIDHYAIIRKPKLGRGKGARKIHEYDQVRHRLWVQDLKRYGIECVEIDEYTEIPELLLELEARLARQSVFVSGSFPDMHIAPLADRRRLIEQVAQGVGTVIAKRGLRLVSGFGLVVGSAVIAGALDERFRSEVANLERAIFLRPFPQLIPEGWEREVFWRRYREDLVQQAGICVYVGGVKDAGEAAKNRWVPAAGVLSEFEIAERLGRIPVPVGATGGAAEQIWSTINGRFSKTYPGMARGSFDRLADIDATADQLISAVEQILVWASKRA